MTTDFYNLLLTDSALALLLLGLFWYVSRVSRGVRGILSWGIGHFLYTLGAAMLDGTAQELERAGSDAAVSIAAALGGLLACSGLALLAWSLLRFVQQRPLRRCELALLPLFALFSVIAWYGQDPIGAQGAAMSAAELGMLAVMLWQLRRLDLPPLRLPARLMMLGCAVLAVLYARDLLDAFSGSYASNVSWVNVDLSTWYLLNFCMLMLTSFRAAESLRQSAMLDPLTGTLNRRGLFARLDPELEQLTRNAQLAVIALDLDRFKRINDRHGHEVGDLVLQALSDTVRACLRESDVFARVGGEEFLVVVTGAEAMQAPTLAESIRRAVATMRLDTPTPPIRVTVSIGVCLAARPMALSMLLRGADEALYVAKRGGRDCVVTHTL
ncbi:GGDEF domain-containing protein [Xanthomonas sp. XNM01]|uniref:GGDEF domain-containing protein n=1 Tax=Xanthomonas sp. XNM01 TaxID=2769289 RepID=UPI001786FEAE|nr:GGDEF domain-containing protein [Xanthomonas sp. XNM01]MBD9369882.1 GGDEF domain-containing protein [Xanthomonas sp. XNM01]